MLLLILLLLGDDPTARGRRAPRIAPGAACRQPDGRLHLGCLPPGTVRALPQAVPAPAPLPRATATPHR